MLKESKKEKGEILFGNLCFRKGVNVTVRRGVKWHGAEGIYKARASDPKIKGDTEIIVIGTDIHRLTEIPAASLRWEHDPDCISYDGLLKAMRRAYGDEFSPLEYVTVIFFILRDEVKKNVEKMKKELEKNKGQKK